MGAHTMLRMGGRSPRGGGEGGAGGRGTRGAHTMLRMGGRSPRGGGEGGAGGRGTRAGSSPRFVYPSSPVRPQFFSPSQVSARGQT